VTRTPVRPARPAPPDPSPIEPSPTEPSPTEPSRRLDAIDVARGLALFGVLMVNLVTEFRVSIFAQFMDAPLPAGMLDRAVLAFVREALEMKAFALFSFLFGVGLALQYERLAATGRPVYWLTRRLGVLLGFGLIHLLLVWNGDILTEYALAGVVVLPLLAAPRRVQGLAAAALFALYLSLPLLPPVVPWPDPAWIARHVAAANAAYANGGWTDVVRFNIAEAPALLPLHVTILPRTLGLFVLGMLAWRSGVFAAPARHRALLVLLFWVLGSAGAGVTLAQAFGVLPGALASWANLAPVCLALAFAAAVVFLTAFTHAGAWLRAFAPIGRMAFTNYLMQSVLFGTVFFGYGLGQFGKLAPPPVFAFGVAVYAAQVALSRLWLQRYRFGPVEWLWRTLMLGRRQPFRRTATIGDRS
jgi:uncharacterized protein